MKSFLKSAAVAATSLVATTSAFAADNALLTQANESLSTIQVFVVGGLGTMLGVAISFAIYKYATRVTKK